MLQFTKMQAAGNDYVYIDCTAGQKIMNPSALSRRISDRHFGVGSDGMVLILPSQVADFRMDMYNADGSQAEMCGNAIRCVGKYIFEKGLSDQLSLTIETLAGIKVLELYESEGKIKNVRVDMGPPILDPAQIPVAIAKTRIVNEPIAVADSEYPITCVSMGNPHAVIFCEDVDAMDVHGIGAKLESHALFPRKTNVEFVKVLARDTIQMRVWERGSGETLACGTGACAAVVAAVLNGLAENNVTVQLRGGTVSIYWDRKQETVFMTGEAQEVFNGTMQDEEAAVC